MVYELHYQARLDFAPSRSLNPIEFVVFVIEVKIEVCGRSAEGAEHWT
jgi:hypothetical protein